jgi:hypothetical protein
MLFATIYETAVVSGSPGESDFTEGVRMVDLTLLDHLRLTFGHVVHRHRAHTKRAHATARWHRSMQGAEALSMIAVTILAARAAFGGSEAYATAAAIVAVLALATLVVHLTFDLDRSAQAHAACASRLWMIRERYRSLLSDLRDGVIGIDVARRQRDLLMEELHAIYESAPPTDPQAYRTAGETVAATDDGALTDEEIDLFLPTSLQKPRNSPT